MMNSGDTIRHRDCDVEPSVCQWENYRITDVRSVAIDA